jgi:hypothetical protein
MSQAKDVLSQIKIHYPSDHCFNYVDLLNYLKGDQIDNTQASIHGHSGYDESDSGFGILYYKDGSILVVSQGLEVFVTEKKE